MVSTLRFDRKDKCSIHLFAAKDTPRKRKFWNAQNTVRPTSFTRGAKISNFLIFFGRKFEKIAKNKNYKNKTAKNERGLNREY